ncbi:MAG: 4Fe-4S binding protein, partial [Eubacteriales bacterium]|nr:4Fe-4S binding protein [Eubacteriales bacterium]
DEKYEYEIYKEIEREWGYKNAPIGGVNPIFGSTVSNDLSSSREGYVPIFDKEKCIQCGLCDSTCPDMVFQFVSGEYKGKKAMVNLGPDYHHCKGCLRCTEICPTKALTVGLERNADLSKTHIRNQQLILDKLKFEDVGANSYITSETNKEDLNV